MSETKAVVSAILIRSVKSKTEVYLQTRWKPDKSPTYSGLLEIPAGGIESYENVYDALKREVKEECGLDIMRIIDDYQGQILEPKEHDKAFVFKPFICQQVLETNGGLPWIGFVFVCEVEGEVKINETEAKDPLWVSVSTLKDILKNKPESVFPLQLPALEYFFTHFDPHS